MENIFIFLVIIFYLIICFLIYVIFAFLGAKYYYNLTLKSILITLFWPFTIWFIK